MTAAVGSSATTRPRRVKMVVAAAVAALFALTGCAAAADEPAGAGTADGLLPPAEGVTEYPLTLRTWAGETVLTERPERVAVVGASANLDAMQALGASPVYTLGEDVEWPWRDLEWMSEIEVVDSATRKDPLNFEAIAAATPDLIIAVNFVQEQGDFDKLSAIAPVLEAEEQVDGDKIVWQDTQQVIGDALDLGTAAQEIIAEAERTIDGTAEAHPEFEGRTMTIAYDYTDYGMDYYSVAGGTVEQVIGRLGFAPNPLAEEFTEDPVVSEENLGLLDGDALVVFYDTHAVREEREGSGLFQAVPPVSDGRYVPVVAEDEDSGAEASWVLRRGASAVSLPWTVEQIAQNWLADVEFS